ncbi:hypothetical protein ACQPZ8_03880 [Actinomadura nitritigenes]|uniref:hypothetical protein n=1 Tax=Actinomadura nitritigenes TaxID=134602 RepID=UPI00346B94FA
MPETISQRAAEVDLRRVKFFARDQGKRVIGTVRRNRPIGLIDLLAIAGDPVPFDRRGDSFAKNSG